jgi:hypothetical protein
MTAITSTETQRRLACIAKVPACVAKVPACVAKVPACVAKVTV